MTNDSTLANVSAALFGDGESEVARSLLEMSASLCSDTLWVGDPAPSDTDLRCVPAPGDDLAERLLAACQHARCERVLVIDTRIAAWPLELLLALVAWPESDAVMVAGDAGPLPGCAIYRREAVVAALNSAQSAGERTWQVALDALSVDVFGGDDLARVSAPPA